ncbi:hypothetical protein [Edaphobacillus lindanitolerans]|uniref:Uncharacterized protein n=1 Tax=Edaphobacillus lindanitolerans TaxID=550447 RepID=A0A1U7PIP5_9BACI|nr:hypothetical protein [Edaphobacillus lindanitolerans]SIT75116.1 hypothetical protein SAMN05428946_1135 [Edaphobacillus lindanitolerans]
MATKSKSDRLWMILSIVAIAAAAASLLYCSGFIADFLDRRGAGEAIAQLRQMMKGSAL